MTIEQKTCSIQQFSKTANCGHDTQLSVSLSLISAQWYGITSNDNHYEYL